VTVRDHSANMKILVISRDRSLMNTRRLVLHSDGYQILTTTNLIVAISLSRECHMAIICHTFTFQEQCDLIERMHEINPGISILCLSYGILHPERFLELVAACFNAHPGSCKTWRIGPDFCELRVPPR
jgi:hypothetical protein